MLSEYGVDLRVAVNEAFSWPDVDSGSGWSARRLWALVEALPRSSALWRDTQPVWSAEELLAALVELQSQGQVTVPRGDRVGRPSNVVSIADFVQSKSKHQKG